MTGKSSLSRFRCPDTVFAVAGVLGGIVASPFYSEDKSFMGWSPPQPDSPFGSEDEWFKSANLLTFSNAVAGGNGGFEAANKLFSWEVSTALDLRGYAGDFTIFCRLALASGNYSGTVWHQGEELGLSIVDGEKVSVAIPFISESGASCAVGETIAVEPLPSGVFTSCALIWNNSAKQLRVYLRGVRIAELLLPGATSISAGVASGRLTLGGGGDLTVYSWSMFSATLSEDALVALSCGLG